MKPPKQKAPMKTRDEISASQWKEVDFAIEVFAKQFCAICRLYFEI
jgi:hypothetical protein